MSIEAMNERLKELAAQAGLQPYYDREFIRFAELVIKYEREQAEKQFNLDWDQQAVLVERIRELEKQNQHLIYGNDCLWKALKMVAYEVKSPRKSWVGLTVDEIVELSESEENTGNVWMALNVQAKLKEKNT